MSNITEVVSEQERTLTSHEAAELLQVNPTSVNKWVSEGKLKCYKTPGGHRRIMWKDFEAFTSHYKMPIRGTVAKALDFKEYARLLFLAGSKGTKKAEQELADFEKEHFAEVAAAQKEWRGGK